MTASHSDALVLFGVTGDLAHKMILIDRSHDHARSFRQRTARRFRPARRWRFLIHGA